MSVTFAVDTNILIEFQKQVLVMRRDKKTEGALKVKLRSASLTDPINMTVPLRVSDAPTRGHREFLLQRLDLFPSDLAPAIEAAAREEVVVLS